MVQDTVGQITEKGLHIIAGDSAAGSFKQAFKVQDRLLIHRDTLTFGPLVLCDNLQNWIQMRNEFLLLIYGAVVEDFFSDTANDLLVNTHRLSDAEEIYLWVTSGVEEQLLICFIIYLLDLIGADTSKLNLVLFENVAGFKTKPQAMGLLDPEQMANHPDPIKLNKESIDIYRLAWLALSSNKPDALVEFTESDDPKRIKIKDALKVLLKHYPDVNSGLNYWDRQLLHYCHQKGPAVMKILAYTMGNTTQDGIYAGDYYLFSRLKNLAREDLPEPLLRLSGQSATYRELNASLTPFAEDVLSAKRSAYPTNPINEWIGGVHLSSEQNRVWFYDDGRLITNSHY